jgi:hypothetical protein
MNRYIPLNTQYSPVKKICSEWLKIMGIFLAVAIVTYLCAFAITFGVKNGKVSECEIIIKGDSCIYHCNNTSYVADCIKNFYGLTPDGLISKSIFWSNVAMTAATWYLIPLICYLVLFPVGLCIYYKHLDTSIYDEVLV